MKAVTDLKPKLCRCCKWRIAKWSDFCSTCVERHMEMVKRIDMIREERIANS